MPDEALLNLRRDHVLRFLSEHPSLRESMIVADAYEVNTPNSWVAPLYHQVRVRVRLCEYACAYVRARDSLCMCAYVHQ
jgi:hypothetical protein